MPQVIPFIPSIASSIGGLFGAHSKAKAANQAADQQRQLAQQQSSISQQMQKLSGGQFQMGMPALQKAMQHYTTLATGTRGAIDSALAPERAQLTDAYTGAQRGLETKIAAGPAREMAEAQLARQKAGQLGLMPAQAREGAYTSLANLGGRSVELGSRLLSGSSSPLDAASKGYQSAYETGKEGRGAWSDYGSTMAKMWGGPLTDWLKKRRGGGGSFPVGEDPWSTT